MKILRQGPKPVHTRPIIAECKHCGTLVEAQHEDILVDGFKMSGYHFNGTATSEDLPYLCCPACQHDIVLPKTYLEYAKQRIRSET